MPWYYNAGNVARPVQVKPGVTVSVKPHTKVEIVKMTPEAQALIRKGVFRRTGKPRNAKPVEAPKDEPKIEEVVGKSDMAKKIAEKGKTTSKNKPPKRKDGKPEMTEGEQVGAKKGADLVDGLSKAAAADGGQEKEGAGKKRR